MFLSLSYDHRVVDGALGGSFLNRVAHYLESFDNKRIMKIICIGRNYLEHIKELKNPSPKKFYFF